MAIRIASHLHRNRFGIYYFRQSIPADLRPFFLVSEIYQSLRTGARREAVQLALPLAWRFPALFAYLRIVTGRFGSPRTGGKRRCPS